MEKDAFDEYFIAGTEVLKNKIGITDKEKLEREEQNIVLKKLTYLQLDPIEGNCDFEHLKKIHKFLFEDVYDFAGELRNCTLAKNMYNFCDFKNIEEEMKNTIHYFKNELKTINTKDEYVFLLAPFYYELIRIHPFREGNGRAIREFVREVVEYSSELPFKVELDYTKMDPDNLLLGTKERYIYPSLLEYEFMKALVSLEKEKLGKKG